MNDYARLKGNATTQAPAATAHPSAPPRELTDAEQARVAENRAFVLAHLPELVHFIKDLHAVGYLDGWRAVENCKLNTSK